MKPLITLTTDFGTQDGYVGAMKGRMLSLCPDASIVDISHDISPQDIMGGAWCLARSTTFFPHGAIHIAVIDPGVGSSRSALFLRSNGHWYVGPDNGVFELIINQAHTPTIYRAFAETEWWKPHQSFDGLAVFTPLAACLANGIDQNQLGTVTSEYAHLTYPAPESIQGTIKGEIITFDRFGNAITNISEDHLPEIAPEKVVIRAKNQRFTFCQYYQKGSAGVPIAMINSDGMLELSTYEGSAQTAFALERGDDVSVNR